MYIFPSKTKVKCKVSGCEKEVRKDRLQDHMTRYHGNKDFVPSHSQTLASFFKSMVSTVLI